MTRRALRPQPAGQHRLGWRPPRGGGGGGPDSYMRFGSWLPKCKSHRPCNRRLMVLQTSRPQGLTLQQASLRDRRRTYAVAFDVDAALVEAVRLEKAISHTVSLSLTVRCRAAQEPYIASMGIYVLKASAIRQLLNESFPDVRAPQLKPNAIAIPLFCGCFNIGRKVTCMNVASTLWVIRQVTTSFQQAC